MFKANDFDRDGCRTFIVQFPCRKMKSFLFAQIISEKNCFQTLRSTILHLFLFSDNPQTILKPLHRQSFLPASIPAQTIFLTSFSPQISNLFPATFMFSSRFLPASNPAYTIFLTGLNPYADNLSYLLQSQVPKIGNLRYLCNFSSFSFYSSEYQFQVHDFQILLFFM